MVASIASGDTKVTSAAGAGPEPFKKVTVAPDWKPEPVIVTLIQVPAVMLSGTMVATDTPVASSSMLVAETSAASNPS